MSNRIFVDAECKVGSVINVPEEDAHHLRVVLRKRAGDPVEVVAGGRSWSAQIEAIDRKRMTVRIIEESSRGAELPSELIVLQALPKGNKMDEVVEKVTELGAARVVPLVTDRSYGAASPAKVERWRRIARAAASQSRRLKVPIVTQTLRLQEALVELASQALLLFAWEKAPRGSLALACSSLEPQSKVAIFVGPEGSFTSQELASAHRAGAHLVSLGSTTLRTETAAAAAIAAICTLRGWW